MASSSARDLEQLIQRLQAERQVLQGKIAEIDGVFSQYGINAATATAAPAAGRGRGRPIGSGKPGRPKGTGKPGRPTKVVAAPVAAAPIAAKKRGRPKAAPKTAAAPKVTGGRPAKSGVTGNDSILNFVNSRGSATSGEINKQWLSEGRKGNVFNILGKLVSDKKLTKEHIKGQMGSVYRLA